MTDTADLQDQLVYDYTYMMAESIGQHGATMAELEALLPTLDELHQDYLRLKDDSELGYARLPYEVETVATVKKLAQHIRQHCSTLVVLGIGGSDLGARALHQALNHTYYNSLPDQPFKLYFAGANTDPKELADLLDILDLEHTAINVISKSGDTIETMSTFVLLRDRLIAAVGHEQAKQHIIISTDAAKGSLRAIVEREGYQSLVVPADVGGRFSVLSSVGLFPAAYVGIDIEALLAGAIEMDERIDASPGLTNPAAVYAALQYVANTKRGQHISVMMPYAEGLRAMAMWYRQIWAESLGKKDNVAGQTVHIGPTPVASVGATDQHSQVQLYNEGPFDKVITLVEVVEFSRSLTLPDQLQGLDELNYLRGIEFGDLIRTEAQATALALAGAGRPNGTLILPQLDERILGQLIYFFEVATTYSGGLYQIDPYNQPGVEAGKKAMYALLGRAGYTEHRQELEALLHPATTYRV